MGILNEIYEENFLIRTEDKVSVVFENSIKDAIVKGFIESCRGGNVIWGIGRPDQSVKYLDFIRKKASLLVEIQTGDDTQTAEIDVHNFLGKTGPFKWQW